MALFTDLIDKKEQKPLFGDLLKPTAKKEPLTLDERATKPRLAPPAEFKLSDYSVPQPYEPSEPPIPGADFKAGAIERAAIAGARRFGLPQLLPVEEAGLAGGAAVPSPEELKRMPWYEKLPEYGGIAGAELYKLAAMHGILKGIGLIGRLGAHPSVIQKAGEAARWFGGATAIDLLAKRGAAALAPEKFKVPTKEEAVLDIATSAAIGATLSLGLSGAGSLGRKLFIPSEKALALRALGLKRGAAEPEIRVAIQKLGQRYKAGEISAKDRKIINQLVKKWLTRQPDIVYRANVAKKAQQAARIAGKGPTVATPSPVQPPQAITPAEPTKVTPPATIVTPTPVKPGLEAIAEQLPKPVTTPIERVVTPPEAKEKITPVTEPKIGVKKPIVAEEKPAAKEPWEMTAKELVELKKTGELEKRGIEPWQIKKSIAIKTQRLLGGNIKLAEQGQERLTKKAVAEGKPVPRQVLAEYKSEKWAAEALAKPAEAKAEITKEPRRAKTIETIRKEGQKKADVTVTMPGNLEDEIQFQKFVKQFPKIRSVDWPPVKAQKAIIKRFKRFAQGVPEFKLNPTFTFEKELGQLVFKDRYRFAFYPDHFGLDAEKLKDGQTIRFDLDSFGIKKPTKAALRKAEPFLGEPKILGRVTKKPTPLPRELLAAQGKPRKEPKKPTKAYKEYYNALIDIETGKKTEVPGGITISQVTEKDIEKAAKLGKKAGQKAWTVEKSILSRQERGLQKQTVDIDKAIKIIRNVFAKPKEPPGPSQIGFPRVEKAELPLEAVGKEPTTARKIIEHLSKALKVPYRSMATHRPRAAVGLYFPRARGIRQINVRSLNTAFHEAGHHIDYFWKIRRAGVSKIGRKTWKMPEGAAKGTAAELTRLGKALYGTRKPPGGYRSEGVAEFIRGYVTGDIDVKKQAPKFHKWFTKDYLPNNPEVANALQNTSDMFAQYKAQGAEARIESQINKKEINQVLANRAKMANLWMQEMFVDEFAPLRVGIEEAGIERAKLKPSEDPYELAVFFSQKEGARARQMVLSGTIDLWGNKTGRGLKEIMKPIADQNAVREFTHWIVSARSLDLLKRGINPGISKKDAQYVYDLYKENEGWKETAKEITDWNHRVLNYLVQAGALQKEVANKMAELNPIYVPFMRAFSKGEKRFGGGGAGRGLITTKKGVFAIKGSGREIIDPFESMVKQTRRMISIGHKSVIARALAKLETKHRGLAGFIWKVPAPKRAMTFQAEQVKKQLMEMGVEFPEAGLEKMDALLTVYGNSPIYFGKENIICIVENGKRNWYEVSPEMYRLLQGLDKFYLPRFLDITLGKAGRSVRLGATGINASFGLVFNPIRDAFDTVFKGTHARGPWASIKGVAKDLSRLGFAKSLGIEPSKAAQEYVAMGGQISGFVGQDRKSLQHLRGEMLASSIGRYSIHTVSHPIDALRGVFGVPESGPRIQEYEKALEAGEKRYGKGSPEAKIYAFNKAQDQTINYSRHGVVGKWLNQMIPFWNANAQDISKVHRTFRTRGKQATAYAVAFLTLPALGLWWYNKDEEWYKEIPAYEKANYIHVKIPGKNRILRIPVPFLVGHIFQGFPVAIVDALYRADKTKVTQFFGEVLKGDVYPLVEWPAIVSPIIDVLQNKDWAGRPIVPRGVEGKLPSDQYKEYTSEFCKVIGKVFNYSPAKIEHLLNSWSGGLYRRTGMVTERLLGLREKEIQSADWPLIGRLFVRDPYAPKASIEKFYKEKERLNEMYQSHRIVPNSDLDKKRKRYNAISIKYLSPYWKALTKTKTIKQREQIYKKIGVLVKVK